LRESTEFYVSWGNAESFVHRTIYGDLEALHLLAPFDFRFPQGCLPRRQANVEIGPLVEWI
jgi:hypothetical protein